MGHLRWVAKWGGGVPRKKKSYSEFAETCSRFGIFEIRQTFSAVGGGGGGMGPKIKVAQNVLKHALILEFLKSGNFFFWVKKFNRQKCLTDRHHSDHTRHCKKKLLRM